jgi:hypothetical protein
MKWSISFPREDAKDGQSHVSIGFKHGQSPRARMEFVGQLRREDAEKLFVMAVEMSKNTKSKETP